MEIKEALQADADVVAEIVRAANIPVAEQFGLTRENAPNHPSFCTGEWILKGMDRGETYYLVTSGGAPAGCVAYESPGPDLAFLNRLAVLPEAQGRGLGTALVDHVVQLAGSRGKQKISIGIIKAHTRLKSFYKHFGFVPAGTKQFAHLPFDVLFMHLDLDQEPGVKEAFSKYAMVYDETRRKFIPCFDDFYGVALQLLPRDNPSLRILDLGAGTGLFSAMVLEDFPEACILMADISDAMLDQARARFQDRPGLDFQVLDYSRNFPDGPFDAVISALSIHHLNHGRKQALFERIYRHLAPGGIFINADQAMGGTEEIDAYYRECWFERIRKSGVTDEEMAGALERMKEDRMSTLQDQLDWLNRAGFSRVNCWYKYYNFVVYSGTRNPKEI